MGGGLPCDSSIDRKHLEYLNRQYFTGLNGIRCLAVIAVIWHHSNPPQGLPIYMRGHFGVDLFFILSGFLISTILIREKDRTGKISFANFWARRALRLMPAYYLFLSVISMVYLLKPSDPDAIKFFRSVPIHAFYLSNWRDGGVGMLNHTWTLSTEQQFYLLWPLTEGFLTPLSVGVAWLAAFIGNQAMNFGLLDSHLQAWGLLKGTGERSEIAEVTFAPILLGVLMAHLLHYRSAFSALSKLGAWPGSTIVFGSSIVILVSLEWPTLDGLPRLILHVLAALLILSIILVPDSSVAKTLEYRPIRYIGTISYGMYLYHMLCGYFGLKFVDRTGMDFLMFPFTLVLTICVAATSYHLFEARFLALTVYFREKGRFGSRRNRFST